MSDKDWSKFRTHLNDFMKSWLDDEEARSKKMSEIEVESVWGTPLAKQSLKYTHYKQSVRSWINKQMGVPSENFVPCENYSSRCMRMRSQFYFDEFADYELCNTNDGKDMYKILALMMVAQVLSWIPEVKQIDNVDVPTMLALIHIESTGDENAVGSPRYQGLLQIGQAYMTDALEYVGRELDTPESLVGNGRYSLQIFNWYMSRWSHVHNWEPRYVALTHKAGGPAARLIIKDAVESGDGLIDASERSTTPTAAEFIIRFDEFYKMYKDATMEVEG